MNRGDDFLAHRKMDNSDGWNVMEKQKKPVLSKALHCVRGQKERPVKKGTASEMINSIPHKSFLS